MIIWFLLFLFRGYRFGVGNLGFFGYVLLLFDVDILNRVCGYVVL